VELLRLCAEALEIPPAVESLEPGSVAAASDGAVRPSMPDAGERTPRPPEMVAAVPALDRGESAARSAPPRRPRRLVVVALAASAPTALRPAGPIVRRADGCASVEERVDAPLELHGATMAGPAAPPPPPPAAGLPPSVVEDLTAASPPRTRLGAVPSALDLWRREAPAAEYLSWSVPREAGRADRLVVDGDVAAAPPRTALEGCRMVLDPGEVWAREGAATEGRR
jgi:hypothetical protein